MEIRIKKEQIVRIQWDIFRTFAPDLEKRSSTAFEKTAKATIN